MSNRNALVLSGGSVKGSFQAGALPEVFRAGFVPDAIYGVSVGSLNGAFLAERAGRARKNGKPVDWVAIAEDLSDFWTNRIRGPGDLVKKRAFSGLPPAIFNHFKSILKPTGLEELIETELDLDNLRHSPVKLSVGAVDVRTGTFKSVGTDAPRIKEWILASSAIPVVMPIVDIRQNRLLDGGTRQVAPLAPAIADGAESIVAIVCQAENPAVLADDYNYGNLIALAERLMDVAVNALVNNDLARCREVNALLRTPGVSAAAALAGKRVVRLRAIRPDIQPTFDIQSFTAADIAALQAEGKRIAQRDM